MLLRCAHGEHLHDVRLVFLLEVLLEHVCRLLVHLLVLRELQSLQFVEESALLNNGNHRVDSVGVDQLIPTTFHDKAESFERDDEEARLFRVKDGSDRPNNTLVDHRFNLLGCGMGCRVGQAPDSLLSDVHGLARHQIDDFVDKSDIDAGLDLLWAARSHV